MQLWIDNKVNRRLGWLIAGCSRCETRNAVPRDTPRELPIGCVMIDGVNSAVVPTWDRYSVVRSLIDRGSTLGRGQGATSLVASGEMSSRACASASSVKSHRNSLEQGCVTRSFTVIPAPTDWNIGVVGSELSAVVQAEGWDAGYQDANLTLSLANGSTISGEIRGPESDLTPAAMSESGHAR